MFLRTLHNVRWFAQSNAVMRSIKVVLVKHSGFFDDELESGDMISSQVVRHEVSVVYLALMKITMVYAFMHTYCYT